MTTTTRRAHPPSGPLTRGTSRIRFRAAQVIRACDELALLDDHLHHPGHRLDAAALHRHLAGLDADDLDHWCDTELAGIERDPAALAAVHAAEHAAEIRQARFRLDVAEARAARPVTAMASLIAELPEGTLVSPPYRDGDPGTGADGNASVWMIFPGTDEGAKARRWFAARYLRTWVQLGDRCQFLDYENTWADVNGHGLHLSTFRVRDTGRDRQAVTGRPR